MKARLGGRLRLIISGGAALSAEVEEFLRVTCCALFVQGYGKTMVLILVSLAQSYVSRFSVLRHDMFNELLSSLFVNVMMWYI